VEEVTMEADLYEAAPEVIIGEREAKGLLI
jgi:hypothetical protein